MRFSGYFFVLPQDALHSLDPIHTTHVRRGQFLLNPREPILGGVSIPATISSATRLTKSALLVATLAIVSSIW